MNKNKLTYQAAGVDRDASEQAKGDMAALTKGNDPRILNGHGAFASLFEASFPGFSEPVLVMKTEEPGSKQLLAFQHDRIESVCRDMLHHLLNDIATMGAVPLFAQDAILCGRLEKDKVLRIVSALSRACREHGCTLTGGETSEQPGVIPEGTYLLTSSVVGIVEKSKIIDGRAIREGDILVVLPSNGLHTNGYSLVRSLLSRSPELASRQIDGDLLINVLLREHTCYLPQLRSFFGHPGLHGLAHITGGGIPDNLSRILPIGVDAVVELFRLKTPAVFRFIQEEAGLSTEEMLRTFNIGAGMIAVVSPDFASVFTEQIHRLGCPAYVAGRIEKGNVKVRFEKGETAS